MNVIECDWADRVELLARRPSGAAAVKILCAAATGIAVGLTPACGAGTVDVRAFVGPPPGVVNVYKRSGEISERLTYIQGVAAQANARMTVREQIRKATDRPEQRRVLGQAVQYDLIVRDGALIQQHKTTGGRIMLKVPRSGTVHWRDGVDVAPGPADAPRFECSATAPMSKLVLGKNRQTVLVTCELPGANGAAPFREVTLYAEGIGMVERTESVVYSAAALTKQTSVRQELIAISEQP